MDPIIKEEIRCKCENLEDDAAEEMLSTFSIVLLC